MKYVRLIVVGVLGVAVLFGCGKTGAQSAHESSSDAPSDSTQYGAPKIEHPLNVEQHKSSPCSLIPEKAVNSYKLGNPDTTSITLPTGKKVKNCIWRSPRSGGKNDTLSTSLTGSGLDSKYGAQRKGHFYDVFKPVTIGGYPAVYATMNHDKANGSTSLILGVSDNESINIQATTYPVSHKRAIGLTNKAASSVLHNISQDGG